MKNNIKITYFSTLILVFILVLFFADNVFARHSILSPNGPINTKSRFEYHENLYANHYGRTIACPAPHSQLRSAQTCFPGHTCNVNVDGVDRIIRGTTYNSETIIHCRNRSNGEILVRKLNGIIRGRGGHRNSVGEIDCLNRYGEYTGTTLESCGANLGNACFSTRNKCGRLGGRFACSGICSVKTVNLERDLISNRENVRIASGNSKYVQPMDSDICYKVDARFRGDDRFIPLKTTSELESFRESSAFKITKYTSAGYIEWSN